jgi:hypothetical protein
MADASHRLLLLDFATRVVLFPILNFFQIHLDGLNRLK